MGQAYRGLQHDDARAACEAVRNQAVSQAIKVCADTFVELQSARHAADYDPLHRLTRAKAIDLVQRARDAIGNLRSAIRKDRRAFAVQVLVRRRSHGDAVLGVRSGAGIPCARPTRRYSPHNRRAICLFGAGNGRRDAIVAAIIKVPEIIGIGLSCSHTLEMTRQSTAVAVGGKARL
jgi:hypothetical protein